MVIFDAIFLSDQTFWVICAGFYLVDHIRLHSGRELLLSETLALRWMPLLPINHYRVGGRAVTLLRPWFPFLGVVKLGWLKSDGSSPALIKRTQRLLRFYQRLLMPFRILASVSFLELFAIGPILTRYGGLGYALSIIVPVHIACLAILIILFVSKRRVWCIGWWQLTSLTFECAVCPGYFVNICRKLLLACVHVPADAITFFLKQQEAHPIHSFACALDLLVEDFSDQEGLRPQDSEAIAGYEAQLAMVRADA